jgi:hypothetical protein
MKWVNSKGHAWYLYSKERTLKNNIKVKSYYFSKTPNPVNCEIPVHLKVVEGRNGTPFVKRV